jgi:serine/threonine protein kinase
MRLSHSGKIADRHTAFVDRRARPAALGSGTGPPTLLHFLPMAADFGPNWQWVRNLDEGGQGHIFVVKCTDGADDSEYVLKQLKNLKRKDRFEREVEACKQLNHPNILSIVDADADPKGRPFLVAEYCPRGSLADNPPLAGTPPLEVLEVFRQICAAVAYAHSHEPIIVHRDIKPANILLRADGTPVLGDFGICFIDDDGTRITMTDEVAGSRFYCAPELRDGRLRRGIPETTADVYSLGKVLYWLLSGGRMFDREEHRAEDNRLGQDDPVNPAWELINDLLDCTIVEDWRKRLLTGVVLLERVNRLISILRAGGHAITLSAPQRCMFCAQGLYKVILDGTVPLPPDTLRQNQETARRSALAREVGFNISGTANCIFLICQSCGHVLLFNPAFTPNGVETWRRSKRQ